MNSDKDVLCWALLKFLGHVPSLPPWRAAHNDVYTGISLAF